MKTKGVEYLIDDMKLWWHPDLDKDSRHGKITDLINTLRTQQAHLRDDNLRHLRLYIKRNYEMDWSGRVKAAGADPRIGINAAKSAIDTICARITQQDPHPNFKTEGGRWAQRLKARNLEKFISGVFYETEFYHKARRMFKDAAIFGTGFMKAFFCNGRIHWERVRPGEIWVDEEVSMHSEPQSFFQVRCLPVESVIAMFPDQQKEILTSKIAYESRQDNVTVTQIEVIEAWHKRDANGNNGRHCIVVDGRTLLDEEWRYDVDPLLVFRWNELPYGYYGNGACEDLYGLQEEIDYIMERIQGSTHNGANVWLLKSRNDKTPNSHLNNKLCTIVEYSGNTPPQFYHSQIMNQQVFDHVKWLNELVYNETGVSQMSATSQKPKGIEAAAALQTMLDVESQRFVLLQKAYERAIMHAAKMTVEIARHHYRQKGDKYSVLSEHGKMAEYIDWENAALKPDEYILKIWPVNMLPQSPAGRMEKITQMMQAGLIDSQTGMMLLDFPDVEAHQSLALAATRKALWYVDKVLYENKDCEPREWDDLGRCVRFMQMGMTNAEMEGAPEEVLQRGLEFIATAEGMMTPPEPPLAVDGFGTSAPPVDPGTGMPADPNTNMPGMGGVDPNGAPPPVGPAGPVDPTGMGGM